MSEAKLRRRFPRAAAAEAFGALAWSVALLGASPLHAAAPACDAGVLPEGLELAILDHSGVAAHRELMSARPLSNGGWVALVADTEASDPTGCDPDLGDEPVHIFLLTLNVGPKGLSPRERLDLGVFQDGTWAELDPPLTDYLFALRLGAGCGGGRLQLYEATGHGMHLVLDRENSRESCLTAAGETSPGECRCDRCAGDTHLDCFMPGGDATARRCHATLRRSGERPLSDEVAVSEDCWSEGASPSPHRETLERWPRSSALGTYGDPVPGRLPKSTRNATRWTSETLAAASGVHCPEVVRARAWGTDGALAEVADTSRLHEVDDSWSQALVLLMPRGKSLTVAARLELRNHIGHVASGSTEVLDPRVFSLDAATPLLGVLRSSSPGANSGTRTTLELYRYQHGHFELVFEHHTDTPPGSDKLRQEDIATVPGPRGVNDVQVRDRSSVQLWRWSDTLGKFRELPGDAPR